MTSLLKSIRFEDIVSEEEEEIEEGAVVQVVQQQLCYFVENSLPMIDKTALECLTYLWPTQLSVIKATRPLLTEYLLVRPDSLALLQDHCLFLEKIYRRFLFFL